MAATKQLAANFTAVAACVAALSGCATDDHQATGPQKGAPGANEAAPAPAPALAPGHVMRLIGDGSTAFTGSQPHLPRPERLKSGRKPPQFVVFSWDGAGRAARSCSRASARSPGRTTRR